MQINSVINLSGSNIKPGTEDNYYKWYDEVHVPMLLKFPGLKGVARYQITTPDDKYPNSLAIFEFENEQAFETYLNSPELAEAHQDAISRKWDREARWRVQYKVIKTWRK